jgi:hypothetical protein
MRSYACSDPLHASNEILKGGIPRKINTHHQDIQEIADKRGCLRPGALYRRSANAKIFLPTIAGQQSSERRQQRKRERNMFPLTQLKVTTGS